MFKLSNDNECPYVHPSLLNHLLLIYSSTWQYSVSSWKCKRCNQSKFQTWTNILHLWSTKNICDVVFPDQVPITLDRLSVAQCHHLTISSLLDKTVSAGKWKGNIPKQTTMLFLKKACDSKIYDVFMTLYLTICLCIHCNVLQIQLGLLTK